MNSDNNNASGDAAQTEKFENMKLEDMAVCAGQFVNDVRKMIGSLPLARAKGGPAMIIDALLLVAAYAAHAVGMTRHDFFDRSKTRYDAIGDQMAAASRQQPPQKSS